MKTLYSRSYALLWIVNEALSVISTFSSDLDIIRYWRAQKISLTYHEFCENRRGGRQSHFNLTNWPTYCTNSCFIISLLYSSTCFEQYCAHHQEVKLYYTASGIVTFCRCPFGSQVCSGRTPTECDDTRCCIMQFDLLMMSTILLETCRRI